MKPELPKPEMIRRVTADQPGGLLDTPVEDILSAVRTTYGRTVTKQDVHTTRSEYRKGQNRGAAGTTRRGNPLPPHKPVPAAARVVPTPAPVPAPVPTPKPKPSVLVADLRAMIAEWGWEEVRAMVDALGPPVFDSDEGDE